MTGDQLSKAEIRKDAAQALAESTAMMIGEVTTIVTGAVRGVARVVGDYATELFDLRDATRRAAADHDVE